MTATKHEQILKYIEDLEVGSKVSVRQIAKDLEVSEGTAYRAINQAKNSGLVSSIPKVATVRIEKPVQKQLEDMVRRLVMEMIGSGIRLDENDHTVPPESVNQVSNDILDMIADLDMFG